MRKHSLTPNQGLSLSQSQSISNLCNQRAREIKNLLDNLNNHSREVTMKGKNGKVHTVFKGKKIPKNVVDLLTEKAKLHACQAFLMENIKAKDSLLNNAKSEQADISVIEKPKLPVFFDVSFEVLRQVKEEFGWEQLTASEYNEFLEAEAYAAHIGQFIHDGCPLDVLRKELPTIPAIEWIELEAGKKTPVEIKIHHTPEELLKYHEELAGLHRNYEQRVNYFKAKVKNLTTKENARIAKVNADLQDDATKKNADLQTVYDSVLNKYNNDVRKVRADFEKKRQNDIQEVVTMRINVDARFQKLVDEFLKKLPETKDKII